jgi:hypothetical protein
MKGNRIGIGILAFLAAIPFFSPTPSRAQDYDPPARVARVAYLAGDVSMLFPGDEEWAAAPPNYPMISGDRIYTGDDGRAAIQNGFIDVRLWHDTDVTLTNLADNYEQLGLAQGAIRVRVFSLEAGGAVEVDTPNGAAIIQQPGDYRINAYPDEGESLVEVNAGSVEIAGPGVNQIVDEGQTVQLYGENPIELGLVETPYADDLDQWSADRDRHILNSISARYVSTEMPGYDDLDDSGSWAPTTEYGPVWYPTAMPYGWAPYTFGHWAYVAPWGWTWVDDASWGYAPFHYGRWAIVEGRWGWVPGPPKVVPVYSPALVAFVGGGPHFSIGISVGGGGGVAAWFPIGVGEPYVPWYHCSTNYVRNVNVTNVNVTVIHNTTIVNNYNTFITNTKTVNNVTEINTTNITYVNRTRVVAVPGNMMASGTSIQHAQVRLSAQQQQRLASAPVAAGRPPVEAPAHPVLQAKTNVSRPVAAPQLLTPHGPAAATPAANTARFNPASLPKPQPSAVIRPAVHPVVPSVKPANPSAHPANAAPPNRPVPQPQPVQRSPRTPAANPGQPSQPSFQNRPAQNNQPPRPAVESKPIEPPAPPKPPAPLQTNQPRPQVENRQVTPPPKPAQPNPPRPPERVEQQPNIEPPHAPAAPKPEGKPDNKPKPEDKHDDKKPDK